MVDTGTHYSSFGHMVIIFLIQVGGLGIMAMSTLFALLIGKKIRLKERLLMQEALNQMTVSGVVRLTIYIIKVTLLIEFIGGTILALRWYPEFGWQGVYFGYWHSVSAFCNAGFDLFWIDSWSVQQHNRLCGRHHCEPDSCRPDYFGRDRFCRDL